jgi:predicted acetyltransferase
LFDESRKLASTVFIIPRKMYFEGKILELDGIGGVAADTAFRGKSYANFLMQDAILNMKKRKFVLSILYPFKVEYYAKFGYRDINIPFGIIKTGIDLKISNKYEIRDADLLEKKDIKELERIYNEFCKNVWSYLK